MIVKKTCKKRLTAFISTARRYSHASPDIIWTVSISLYPSALGAREREAGRSGQLVVEDSLD